MPVGTQISGEDFISIDEDVSIDNFGHPDEATLKLWIEDLKLDCPRHRKRKKYPVPDHLKKKGST